MRMARPAPEPVACPACGRSVDALRATTALAFEDGVELPCSEACATRVRAGERTHRRERSEGATQAEDRQPTKVRKAHLPTQRPMAAIDAPEAPTIPLVGLSLGIVGLATAPFALPSALPYVSAIASAASVAIAMRATVPHWKGIGMFPWLGPPAGALIALAGGLFASLRGAHDPWLLIGGAAGALVAHARVPLDVQARIPVLEAANRLLESLPRRVRIPIEDAASGTRREQEVVTDRVRAGEEVLVREGDSVGVDGVVKSGEATVLPYPAARAKVVRLPGDPVLAGARVMSGSMTVLATRVGDERALARPLRFGSGSSATAARLARLAEQASRWGVFVALGLCASAIALGTSGATANPIAAVAAILMVTPLLSLRRAAESPLVAAAAAAAERGLVFASARTLEKAGRVNIAALCSHGTVTEGNPEVVDVLTLDGADPTPLIALSAAAQTAATPSAFSRAIQGYAAQRGVPAESVRRAVYVPGRGVTALSPGGEPFVIGNRQLLLEEGVSVAVADAEAARVESRGQTALFVALGGRVRAVVALQDPVRAGARAAVQRIFDLHVEPVLLSGDHRGTAVALARTLDVDHVKAELLPDERGEDVRRQREAGSVVACFGLPSHDEAALAAADVPIVLGAAGSSTSDHAVASASDDIRDAVLALTIAKATRSESLRGLVTAATAGGVLLVGATLGFLPPALAAVLALAIDAVAMPAGARLLERIGGKGRRGG